MTRSMSHMATEGGRSATTAEMAQKGKQSCFIIILLSFMTNTEASAGKQEKMKEVIQSFFV